MADQAPAGGQPSSKGTRGVARPLRSTTLPPWLRRFIYGDGLVAPSDAGASGEAAVTSPGTPSSSTSIAIAMAVLAVVVIISTIILTHVFSSSGTPASVTPLSAASAVPNAATSPVTGASPVVPLVVPAGLPVVPSMVFGRGPGAPRLLLPQEAVRTRNGNTYVADMGNRRVVELGRSGTVLRTITLTDAGSLISPFSLALAPSGDLFVLDTEAGRIVEYDTAGHFVRATPRSLNLLHARDITITPLGGLLVADPAMNAIFTLSPRLTLLHQQHALSATGGKLFDQPTAAAIGSNGTIFVIDAIGQRLARFSGDWHLLQSWPLKLGDTAHSPRVLPLTGGRALVTDPADAKLLLYTPGTEQPGAYALTGSGAPAQMPLGLSSARLPNVLITMSGSNQVWQVRVPNL